MKAEAWRQQAMNAVDEARRGDPRMLERLALLLEQQEQAVQLLAAKGYGGWPGLTIVQLVERVPSLRGHVI